MKIEIGDNLSIILFCSMITFVIALATGLFHIRQMKRIESGSEANQKIKDAEQRVEAIRKAGGFTS